METLQLGKKHEGILPPRPEGHSTTPFVGPMYAILNRSIATLEVLDRPLSCNQRPGRLRLSFERCYNGAWQVLLAIIQSERVPIAEVQGISHLTRALSEKEHARASGYGRSTPHTGFV